MARFGFVGPTYASQSPNADAERCINMYPEIVEATHGKSQMALYDSPGLAQFCDLTKTETNVRGLFPQNGRCFAAGNDLYEVFSDGTFSNKGPLAASTLPVVIVGNQVQLLILAGGNLWVFSLSTGVLTAVNMAQFAGPVSLIAFSDGFFIALQANSQVLYVSNLLDGTTWNGLNIGAVGVFPDNVVSMLVDHREVWLWGSKAGTVYYDTGAAYFPYAPIPGVYLETGSAATYAQCQLNNTVVWLASDNRGSCVAYQAAGYTPERISNHSVEYLWSQYATISDAIGYAFVDQGHTFWHLYFPTANKSWRFDFENGLWHEVGEWTGNSYTAHRSQCHCYCFGKHLVGDPLSGVIYQQSINYKTYAGRVLRRRRVSPTISKENQWLLHRQLQLDCETGIEPQPPLTGPDPSIITGALPSISQWVLADQSGATWKVTIDGTNEFAFTEVAGTPSIVYLTDQIGGTVYQLGVDSTDPLNPYITLTVVMATPYVLALAVGSQLFLGQANTYSVYVSSEQLTKTIVPNSTARGPIVTMKYSDDNAHTWSNPLNRQLGLPGQYLTRVVWRRLGRSRNRTYEITFSDPVAFRIVEADLIATPGFEPTERLVNLINKGQ